MLDYMITGTTDIAGVYYIKAIPIQTVSIWIMKVKTHGQLLRCVSHQQDYPREASPIRFGWVLHGTRIHP